MSFLTAQPQELAAAAGKLGAVGSVLAAQNAAAAAPTTGLPPAAADEVSALQASLFTAYGTLYQQVSSEATALYDSFVNTLGVSAGTYEATEAANSSAAASPFAGALAGAATPAEAVPSPISDIANILDVGAGNTASAASDLLGLANGGLLVPAGDAAADSAGAEGVAAAGFTSTAGPQVAPVAAGAVGSAPAGALSAPASWGAPATLVSSTGVRALPGAGWTAAPQAAPTTLLPGAPGLAAATRNSAGFGAPRYGVKPLVMPKPELIGT
ncbi:PE domain-containing protein [Mycobacterium sp. 1423905.2]|uniref:PPE family protein, SVP subgroup n=1 Tax=Mycobacterium sp. 1423905.2 TaxID=1856859 RepID=UPI0007FCA0DA|nr:PE domain-containing protein [Mycobacterium sp. 1423905.2]OBJ49598.1 PE family protein [Mycobacterium sp. 1423905.2]